ncbi:MAG: PIN domain-containing protein [Candidatus Scalindua rubra]|uniref:PIN domain protein n=1 Tax=Candidatus Scalindua brodae TaxID=237368 RepID=A0A0B0EC69_9BACT|nr:MAG: PIN domain protein [Candidatus Scalindua brodae]MBZ0110276.1 PIN domain-containing protein [Candidatus Scalindua rubra]TWU33046.1 PIN domain protein [Candidatus Brocadiaceae bacterium S225]
MHKAFIDTSVILRILVQDDNIKIKASVKLIRESKKRGIILHILPVVILEIVWVLEKVYKYDKKTIREHIDAILNTPELRCEMESVFRMAIRTYEEKNIKFADVVMGYWGMERDIFVVYTYDEKDFRRIENLEVQKP